MAETGKEQSKSTWPLVKFQFSVKIGDKEAFFQEVTGLIKVSGICIKK